MVHDKTGKALSSQELSGKIVGRISTIITEAEVYILHVVGCIPSHHIRRLFYRLGGISIGKGSTIHMHARFYQPKGISIHEDTIIGEGTVLDGRATLTIGSHVDFASEVMVYTSQHDIYSEHFAAVETVIKEAVVIEDYVFIGPRAIVLPGVKIGKGAVVGAGAVVTKDVDPFTIVGGVPAKVIGERKDKNPQYKLGRAAWFR